MEMTLDRGLHSIHNITAMQVIDINTGTILGNIKDFVIDCENHKVKSILVPTQKISWFGKESCIEIPWEDVTKIGVDVILVDARDIDLELEHDEDF